MTKKWWQSSTIWINLLGVVLIVLEFVVKSNLIPDPDVVALLIAILNILNRFRASGKVAGIEKKLL